MTSSNRRPQIKPTQTEINSYYRALKTAADGGVLYAMAELIKIDIMTKQDQPPVSELTQAGQQMLDANEELREVVAEVLEAFKK